MNRFQWVKSPKIFTNRSGQAGGGGAPPPPPPRFFPVFFFDDFPYHYYYYSCCRVTGGTWPSTLSTCHKDHSLLHSRWTGKNDKYHKNAKNNTQTNTNKYTKNKCTKHHIDFCAGSCRGNFWGNPISAQEGLGLCLQVGTTFGEIKLPVLS